MLDMDPHQTPTTTRQSHPPPRPTQPRRPHSHPIDPQTDRSHPTSHPPAPQSQPIDPQTDDSQTPTTSPPRVTLSTKEPAGRMDPVKTPLPQLALSALTILAMHTVCAIPLFSPHSEADADAAAEAAAKVKTTVVTGTPTHPVATLPTPDPLSTVLNAALSAIVVVCVVSGLYWAARRLTNGRHPPAPVLAVAAALSALSGCWAPKAPGTHLSISPWTRTVRFDDTKDNRVLVEGLDIDAHNGSAHLDRLEIDNRASSVIEMQVQQMIAHAEQMRVANEGIRLALSGIAEIVARLTALLPPPKPAPPAEDPTGAKPHEPVRLPM